MRNRTAPRKLTKTDRKILQACIPTVQELAAYLGPGYEFTLYSMEDFEHSVLLNVKGEHTEERTGAPITALARDRLDELTSSGKASTVYFRRSREGEPLKSTAIALRNADGNIIGLLCIDFHLNCPLYDFMQSMNPDARVDVGASADDSSAADTAELVSKTISQVRASVMADDAVLPSNKRKAIIEELEDKGIFHIKNAAVIVAGQLALLDLA